MAHPQRTQPLRHFNARTRLLTAAVAACYATAPAWANPINPVVTNGAATFNRDGNVLNITNSNGTIINWDKFSIDKGETTRFIQSSASSSVLNRVVTNDPSRLYGTLSSNGQVWLINTSGILVGAGAVIDTARFVASTLPISDADFLAGRLTFGNTPGVGSVTIESGAEIKTPIGGSVYLVGANVTNEGVIKTPGGETILAAGQTVNLVDTGTPGVRVEITGSAGNATNLGSIVAEAGRIGIAGVIVRNSGTLDASSVVSEGGRVFLKASQDTYVDGAGRIVATGTQGGKVEVLGNRVAVTDSASIDVSGTNGGGTVLVGGDYQGKNPDVQNAHISYFGPQASIKADALVNGDGGKVIVWADDTTRAYGNISARGGALSGNGGFIETSGHRYLDVEGIKVDTSAANGIWGSWLLDPISLTITDTGGSSFTYGGTFTSPDDGSIVSWATIAGQLTGNVTVQTSDGGDIFFQQTNPWTTTNSGDLTFSTAGYISGNWNGTATTQPTTGLMLQTAGNISFSGNTGVYLGNGSVITTGAGKSISATSSLGSVGIGYLKAPGDVTITAAYSIWDDNWQSSGTPGINIESNGNISLTSYYGADPNSSCTSGFCLAISTDTAGTPARIAATVNATATTYGGGIEVRHTGDAPEVDLWDYSTGGGGVYRNFVEFYASGNVTTGGSSTFIGNNVYIGAGGNLNFTGGVSSPGALYELGLWAVGSLTINAATPTTTYFTGMFSNSTLTINNNVNSNGYVAMAAGLVEKADDIETPSLLADIPIFTGGAINIYGGSVSGATGVGFLTGSLTMTGSSIQSSAGNIYGAVSSDIRMNNGATISSGYNVFLALLGTNATIYLNDTAGLSASYIQSGGASATYIDFLSRSSGGVFIDGVETTTSVANGSGFFRGNHSTPATLGAGLDVWYALSVIDPVVTGAVTAAITDSTTSASTSDTSTSTSDIPPPTITTTTTSGDSGSLTLLGTQTVGGGTDEFGGATTTDSTSSSGTTTSTTDSTASSDTTSTTDSTSSTTSASDETKEGDAKEGEKTADSKEGDKKDDKSSGKKPLGKCSA